MNEISFNLCVIPDRGRSFAAGNILTGKLVCKPVQFVTYKIFAYNKSSLRRFNIYAQNYRS